MSTCTPFLSFYDTSTLAALTTASAGRQTKYFTFFCLKLERMKISVALKTFSPSHSNDREKSDRGVTRTVVDDGGLTCETPPRNRARPYVATPVMQSVVEAASLGVSNLLCASGAVLFPICFLRTRLHHPLSNTRTNRTPSASSRRSRLALAPTPRTTRWGCTS
jgi:hypothetical protein